VGIACVHFFSKALGKEGQFVACLPDRQEAPPPYPVFYLLHGLSDDATAWLRWTSVERYVRTLPLIVVMPDGGRGWYSDAPEGMAYETFIVRDLISFVDRYLPTDPRRRARAIGGLSMGGFGAMKLALKHPRLFCSVTSHSGALAFLRPKFFREAGAEFRRIFPTARIRRENDPFVLAKNVSRRLLPRIRFDCGQDDSLIEHNRLFHKHLNRLGIPHEYEEFPGAHEWGYWDTHIKEAIAFHCANFGIKQS